MSDVKTRPRNRLLPGFNLGSIEALSNAIKNEDWDASKLYSSIDTAVWTLKKRGEIASQSVKESLINAGDTPEACDSLVDDLLEILKSAAEPNLDKDTADLFTDAIKNLKKLSGSATEEQRTTKTFIAYITVQALCKMSPTMAFDAEKYKMSAFQNAAKSGTHRLMRIMITELENSLGTEKTQSSKRKVLELMSRKCKGEKTACLMAVEELRLEVLSVLATDYPALVDDGCVTSAITRTAEVKPEDQRGKALEVFKLVLGASRTSDNGKLWKQAVATRSHTIVDYLLKKDPDRFATYENADFLIEHGPKEMWKMFSKESRDKFMSKPGCKLLHTAVSNKKAGIVEAILSEYPSQIDTDNGVNDNSKHPLQHLMDAGDPVDPDIRDQLVHAMIKSSKLEIRDIKRILKRANVEAYPMGLSFPRINTPEETFADYVEWLTEQKSSPESIYKFEKVLKHVTFPDFSGAGPPQSPQGWRMNPTEIRDVFKWLKDGKVETVLSLTVYDRLHQPHSDEDVAACVDGFGVRVLNWRKPDLYLGNLNPIDKNQMAQLQELHLYSSGKRAVHDDWFRELPRFPNLTKLHVSVIEDLLTDGRLQTVKEELQRRLNEINKSPQLNYRWGSSSARENGVPNGDGKPIVKVTSRKWPLEQGEDIPMDINDTAFEVVGQNLDKFLKKFRSYWVQPHIKASTKRVKVAVIDSGVVVFDGKPKTKEPSGSSTWGKYLKHRVVDGISLVSRDTEDEVFWHASEPHGTQMAKLICSIYPLCALYVIKVAETRSSGITANNVADAINWAREKGVDVISLSLVTYGDQDEKLAEAFRLAKDKDIVIMSSTADTGVRKSRTVGGQENVKSDVFSIAACNSNGHLLQQSEQEGFHFCFLGNVRVDPVPTLKSKTRIEGASVATAIAAGTAALTLACCHISEKCKTDGSTGNWKFRMVERTFKSMARGNAHGVPWVDLERFCNKHNELSGGRFQFKDTVERYFVL